MVALAESGGFARPPSRRRATARPAERPVYVEPLFGPEDWRSLAGVLALQALLACLVVIAAHPPLRTAAVVIDLPAQPAGLAPPMDFRQSPLPSPLPAPAEAPSLPEDRPADRALIVLPLRVAVETELRYPTTLLRDGKPKGGPDPRADRLDASKAVDVAVDVRTAPDRVGVPLVSADTLPSLPAGDRLADMEAPSLSWLPDRLPGPLLSTPAQGRLPEGLADRRPDLGLEDTGRRPIAAAEPARDLPGSRPPVLADGFAEVEPPAGHAAADRLADRALLEVPLRVAVETEIRYPLSQLRDRTARPYPDRADRLDTAPDTAVAIDLRTAPAIAGVPLVAGDTLSSLPPAARLADIAAPPLTWLPDRLAGPSTPALDRLPEGLVAGGFENTGSRPVPGADLARDFPGGPSAPNRLTELERPARPAVEPLAVATARPVSDGSRIAAGSEADRMLASLDRPLVAFDAGTDRARSLDAVIGDALDAAAALSAQVAADPAAPRAGPSDDLADLGAPRSLLDDVRTVAAAMPTDHLERPAERTGAAPGPAQTAMDGLALRPLPTTAVSSVHGLRSLLDRGVNPQAVPPVFVSRLPADIDAVSEPDERKHLFVRTLLPIVVAVNERNLARRERIERLADLIDRGVHLKPVEQAFVADIMAEFGLGRWNRTELLSRVDVVPPSLALAQAAEESGWGTSAAARTANSLFGQMLPPSGGQPAMVRPFEDLPATVEAYIRNLNTHRAYADFRRHRAAMRAAGTVPDGEALAQYLHRYSERGGAYIAAVSALIRNNNFASYDDARLAALPVRDELAALPEAAAPAWVR